MTCLTKKQKIDALWGLVITGPTKELARGIMSAEDYVLFEQVQAEFDILMARKEAKRTSSINYVIDESHTGFKLFIQGKRVSSLSCPRRNLGRAKWYFNK